jgi:hypothetical protein
VGTVGVCDSEYVGSAVGDAGALVVGALVVGGAVVTGGGGGAGELLIGAPTFAGCGNCTIGAFASAASMKPFQIPSGTVAPATSLYPSRFCSG